MGKDERNVEKQSISEEKKLDFEKDPTSKQLLQ